MISVSDGYGTDGSRTPTIVAVRVPRRTVLPITDGSLFSEVVQKRYVSTAAPAALRAVVAGAEQPADDRMQPHDVEVRSADNTGADDARLAEADHGEVDRSRNRRRRSAS